MLKISKAKSESRKGVRSGPKGGSLASQISSPQEQKEKMKQRKFPPYWNSERVKKVLGHYESQSEEEALAEDEAAFEAVGQTVMEVPTELVPIIRELIAKHHPA
jgi:hypothetical protein